jgi:hypothetical protein
VSILDYLPIHTDRLILIQTSRDDVDLILKMDKQESTQKFLGGIKNKSRDERIEFLDRKHNNGNSLTVMLDNVSIGFVGLKVLIMLVKYLIYLIVIILVMVMQVSVYLN